MIYDFIKNCNFNQKSIIFEIGAHMGFDTEEIYYRTDKSQMYCFEPDPRNMKILKERGIDKFAKLIEYAISNINDKVPFYLSDGEMPQITGNSYYDNNDWSASSSLRSPKEHVNLFPWCNFKNKIEIKSVTLDFFCKENNINNIDLIWMDVQGCEDLVFLGAKEILKNTKYVYTEYSNQELYTGQKKLLEIINFLPGIWEVEFKTGDDMNGDILLKNINLR